MNNIILLGIVSLINDISSKMILAVLPLYIKQLGGAGVAVGLISGGGESIASLLKVLSGYWSDKIGRRKPFVFSGYGLSAIAKLLFYFAQSWPVILILRGAERTGKGLRSASRDALIAATAGQQARGKGFGIHRAFDSGGAVLGSLVTLVLVWQLSVDIREIFLIAGVVSLFSVVPIFFTRETGSGKKAEQMELMLSFKQLPHKLKLFLIVATVFAFGNFSYMFLVLRAQRAFDAESALLIPIVLYALYNSFYTILAVPAGILADKIGKARVLFIGYALFAVVAGGFIVFDSLPAYIVLFVLYGITYAFVESNERAYVSDLSDESTRGTALGTLFTVTSIVALPAGIIAGLLYDAGPALAFGYAVLTSVAASALLVVQMRQQENG